MIEFKGEISKKTKKLIRRIDLLMLCVVFFAPAAFMVNFVGIPVFVSLYFGTTYMENLWLYIASFIGVSAIFVVSYFVLPLTDHIPLCIQIAPDGTVVTKTKKAQYTHGMAIGKGVLSFCIFKRSVYKISCVYIGYSQKSFFRVRNYFKF